MSKNIAKNKTKKTIKHLKNKQTHKQAQNNNINPALKKTKQNKNKNKNEKYLKVCTFSNGHCFTDL